PTPRQPPAHPPVQHIPYTTLFRSTPQTIDDHARRERIDRRANRFGQFASPAPAGKRLRLCVAQHAEEMPRHGRPFGIDVAANEEDRKRTRLESSHLGIWYAVLCLR